MLILCGLNEIALPSNIHINKRFQQTSPTEFHKSFMCFIKVDPFILFLPHLLSVLRQKEMISAQVWLHIVSRLCSSCHFCKGTLVLRAAKNTQRRLLTEVVPIHYYNRILST